MNLSARNANYPTGSKENRQQECSGKTIYVTVLSLKKKKKQNYPPPESNTNQTNIQPKWRQRVRVNLEKGICTIRNFQM